MTPPAEQAAAEGVTELLPCPFCGGEAGALRQVSSGNWQIWCLRPTQKCGAILTGTSREEAERTWNRRASPRAEAVSDERNLIDSFESLLTQARVYVTDEMLRHDIYKLLTGELLKRVKAALAEST